MSNGLAVVLGLPIFIFAFCLAGPFLVLSLPVNSSANAARSAGVCSIVAPSLGVAVPDPGADGGAEGVGSPIGGLTLDFAAPEVVSSKNARLSAKDALSSGGIAGAVNSGTPILRRAVTSGGAGTLLADTSGAAALASGAALISGAAARDSTGAVCLA